MATIFIRTIIVYLMIIVFMRLMGKRQLGELEPSELVVAVLISDIAAVPLQDTSIPMTTAAVSVATLVAGEILTSLLLLKSVRLRALFCGKPSLLISNGKIDQRQMKKNRYTADELMEELRKQGVTDLTTVRDAVLETDGTLSVLLYPQHSPLTPALAGVEAEDSPYPVIVINQGRTLSNNLAVIGRNKQWLQRYLKENGRLSPEMVYLMTCDRSGKAFVVPFEEK